VRTEDPKRLRELARWYRELAEKAGNPAIWDLRSRHADKLDAEADRIERERPRALPYDPPIQFRRRRESSEQF
jgi:hypothetical protein